MPAIKLECQNKRCQNRFERTYSAEEFERRMASVNGIPCFTCGMPRMEVFKTNRRVKDGFEPGWQENIRKWCDSRSQYNAYVKAMGLQEIGYDYVPQEVKADYSPLSGAEMAREIARMDSSMTGQELDAIESGKYFKDLSCVDDGQ